MKAGHVLATVVVAGGGLFAWNSNGVHTIARPPGFQAPEAPKEYTHKSAEKPITYDFVFPKVVGFLESLPAGSRVLDLGCGNGYVLGHLQERGWELAGVDFSNSGIAFARQTWPKIRFEVGDVTDDLSGLGYGQWDAVISTEVIEHIFLPRKFTANCYKLLKPKGKLVLSTPYHGVLKNSVIGIAGGFDGHVDPLRDYGHIKFWSPATLSQVLFDEGFQKIEWQGAGRCCYLWQSMVIKTEKP